MREHTTESPPANGADMREDTDTLTDETSTMHPMLAVPARRRFFKASGAAVLGGVALAACGGGDEEGEPAATGEDDEPEEDDTTTTTEGEEEETEALDPVVAAQTAAGLGVLAVNTYTSAIEDATDLGVPPAVAAFATTAQTQHQEALDTWNGILEEAGDTPVTEPPAELAETVNSQFAEVEDVAGLAMLALLLEQTAADTYLNAVELLQDPAAITTAAQLQYVDQMHAAILLYVTGTYPVPETFQATDGSVIGG